MLKIVSLLVDFGVVDDNYASGEKDQLLTHSLIDVVGHLDVEERAFHVLSAEAVDPIHFGVDVLLVDRILRTCVNLFGQAAEPLNFLVVDLGVQNLVELLALEVGPL